MCEREREEKKKKKAVKKPANNLRKKGKENKEWSVGLEKVCARCLLLCVPLPPPAPQPRAFSNIQISHSFDNSSKAPGFEGTSCFIASPRFLFLLQTIKPRANEVVFAVCPTALPAA